MISRTLISWPKCELITQLISPSKTSFWNLIESIVTKIIPNLIFSHLKSNLVMNHLHKVLLIEGFPIISRTHSIPFKSFFHYILFLMKMCSIFNNSCTQGLNIVKLGPWCTLTHWGLSDSTKSTTRSIRVWDISYMQQTNKTKQPSFIDI